MKTATKKTSITKTTKKKTTTTRKKKPSVVLSGWQYSEKQQTLARTFVFEKHIEAVVFVARIAIHSEVYAVYPKITITHNQVVVSLAKEKELTVAERTYVARVDHTYDRVSGE